MAEVAGMALRPRGADAGLTPQINEDFHFMLYDAADMLLLLQVIESLWLQVGPTMRFLFPVPFAAG